MGTKIFENTLADEVRNFSALKSKRKSNETIEQCIDEIIEFINQRKEIDEIKTMYPDYDISVNNKDDYIVVAISSKVNLITPGSSIILDNPFPIKVVRYLPYE